MYKSSQKGGQKTALILKNGYEHHILIFGFLRFKIKKHMMQKVTFYWFLMGALLTAFSQNFATIQRERDIMTYKISKHFSVLFIKSAK